MKSLITPLTLFSFLSIQAQVEIKNDVLSEGQKSFQVSTSNATYIYQKDAGGFSNIIDKKGNDWVTFKREPWGEYPASASSSFRGLPNLVWQGDNDGAGHPGHSKCKSWSSGDTIYTETLDKKWKWRWSFDDQYARLDVLKADSTRKYWFLYEGTPGGRFEPSQSYFGTKAGKFNREIPDYYGGKLFQSSFQWLYVGHEKSENVFYLIHLNLDEETDLMSYLGNNGQLEESKDGMTVFGFGRNEKPEPLLSGKNSFIIGFHPKILTDRQHIAFETFVQQIIEKYAAP